MAIVRLVGLYGLPYFFGAWPINNRFASKLADKINVAIRRYLFNKWTLLLVLLKVTAI